MLGDDAHVVRDQQDGGAEVRAAGCFISSQDLRLDRHVERGRRLVGDQQRPGCRRAPSRSSRAGACRRRTGAGSRRRGVSGSGMPDLAQQLDRPRAAPRCVETCSCARICSAICQPTRVDRVQRGHRILEDHRDLARRARAASRAASSVMQVAARVAAPRPRRPRSGRGSAACTAIMRDALAGAGLADDAEHLARLRASNETPSTARTTPSSVRNETRRSRTSSSGSGSRRTRGSSQA